MVRCVIFAMSLVLGAGVAQAQDAVIWEKDVAGWRVAVDRTISNSCFIISGFNNEEFLRFQFNSDESSVQLIVASVHWASVENGAGYEIAVAFDETDTWSGMATGHRWHDILPSLVISVPYADSQASTFMKDFTTNTALRVSYNGDDIANLALDGAEQAVAAMMECQSAMSKTIGADAGVASKDPFAPKGDRI